MSSAVLAAALIGLMLTQRAQESAQPQPAGHRSPLEYSVPLIVPFAITREGQLLIHFQEIKPGMTDAEVEDVLGAPDEKSPLYRPRIKRSKSGAPDPRIGSTYRYLISKKQNHKKVIRVSFDLKDKVTKVDHFGFSMKEDLQGTWESIDRGPGKQPLRVVITPDRIILDDNGRTTENGYRLEP
jgi:hypothetical protein